MAERPTSNQKDIHMPQEEREIKIQLDREHFEDIHFSVATQNAVRGIQNQRDIYYDFPDYRITNLNRGLRVRFDEEKPSCFEFKSLFYNPYGREANPWFIEELTFPFPIGDKGLANLRDLFTRLQIPAPLNTSSEPISFGALDVLFQKLGLAPSATVTKHRSEYESEEAVFTFDFIEELGYFIEVEAKSGHDPISILEQELHILDFRIIREGYNDMMLRGNPNCISTKDKLERFRINPSWNILPTETTYVQDLLRRSQ